MSKLKLFKCCQFVVKFAFKFQLSFMASKLIKNILKCLIMIKIISNHKYFNIFLKIILFYLKLITKDYFTIILIS